MDCERIAHYIQELYAGRQEASRAEYIEETRLKEFIPVVDEDVARLLEIILLIARPKRILEIGTSIGYSTVSMARVARTYGGRISTIEFDEKVALQAKENFIRAGVDDSIDIFGGDVLQIMPTLTMDYDLIFLDVDKKLYPLLLDDCISSLKPGGILMAEDTLFPVLDLEARWQDLIEPIQRFNEAVIASERLDSTLLPVGDGIILAVKRGTKD